MCVCVCLFLSLLIKTVNKTLAHGAYMCQQQQEQSRTIKFSVELEYQNKVRRSSGFQVQISRLYSNLQYGRPLNTWNGACS